LVRVKNLETFFINPVFIFLFFAVLSGCDNNQSFDSVKWQKKGVDWYLSDQREKMIEDLILSDTLIGLNKDAVIALLGEPEIAGDLRLQYLVREKYGWNLDPKYIKHLQIELDDQGKTIRYYVEKTK